MTKDLLQEISDELKEDIKGDIKEGVLQALVKCLIRENDIAAGIVDLVKITKSIPDRIFWNNFYLFLKEENFDEELLKKLSKCIEEESEEKKEGYTTKIIYAINRIDAPEKAKYISRLTLSVMNKEINFNYYFRLIRIVQNLASEDLEYLADNLEKEIMELDDMHVDDFLSNGLIYYELNGAYCYSTKSYDLVEYGIKRGEIVKRPEKLKSREQICIKCLTEAKKVVILDNEN